MAKRTSPSPWAALAGDWRRPGCVFLSAFVRALSLSPAREWLVGNPQSQKRAIGAGSIFLLIGSKAGYRAARTPCLQPGTLASPMAHVRRRVAVIAGYGTQDHRAVLIGFWRRPSPASR